MTDKKLDKLVARLYGNINRAPDLACPLTSRRSYDKNNTWFTDRIEELRQATMDAYHSRRRPNGTEVFKMRKRNTRKPAGEPNGDLGMFISWTHRVRKNLVNYKK